jgi:hypothetical protein
MHSLVFCFTGWLPPFPFCARIIRIQSSFCCYVVISVDGTIRAGESSVAGEWGAKEAATKGRSAKTLLLSRLCLPLHAPASVSFFVQVNGYTYDARVTSSTADSLHEQIAEWPMNENRPTE